MTIQKKYQIRNDLSITLPNGKTLFRIQAIRDIDETFVAQGTLGGFVEGEHNLSHYGRCWIYNDAKVYDQAEIEGDAAVTNNATVRHRAVVNDRAIIQGHAVIYKTARVTNRAVVTGNAKVSGEAVIKDQAFIARNAHVAGKAIIGGQATITDSAIVYNSKETVAVQGLARLTECAVVNKNNSYLVVHNVGSQNATITFYRSGDGRYSDDYKIGVHLTGTEEQVHYLNELCDKLHEIIDTSDIEEYKAIITLAKLHFKI